MVIDYFLPRILIYIQCYHNLNIMDSFFFVLTEILTFSRKKTRGRKDWDNNCDRYSNLTSLYITLSANALLISMNSDNNISFHFMSLKLSSQNVSLRRMWKWPLQEMVTV